MDNWYSGQGVHVPVLKCPYTRRGRAFFSSPPRCPLSSEWVSGLGLSLKWARMQLLTLPHNAVIQDYEEALPDTHCEYWAKPYVTSG